MKNRLRCLLTLRRPGSKRAFDQLRASHLSACRFSAQEGAGDGSRPATHELNFDFIGTERVRAPAYLCNRPQSRDPWDKGKLVGADGALMASCVLGSLA